MTWSCRQDIRREQLRHQVRSAGILARPGRHHREARAARLEEFVAGRLPLMALVQVFGPRPFGSVFAGWAPPACQLAALRRSLSFPVPSRTRSPRSRSRRSTACSPRLRVFRRAAYSGCAADIRATFLASSQAPCPPGTAPDPRRCSFGCAAAGSGASSAMARCFVTVRGLVVSSSESSRRSISRSSAVSGIGAPWLFQEVLTGRSAFVAFASAPMFSRSFHRLAEIRGKSG